MLLISVVNIIGIFTSERGLEDQSIFRWLLNNQERLSEVKDAVMSNNGLTLRNYKYSS